MKGTKSMSSITRKIELVEINLKEKAKQIALEYKERHLQLEQIIEDINNLSPLFSVHKCSSWSYYSYVIKKYNKKKLAWLKIEKDSYNRFYLVLKRKGNENNEKFTDINKLADMISYHLSKYIEVEKNESWK